MSVGLQPTKSDFDQRLGTQSLQVLQQIQQWSLLKAKMDSMSDADLEALGYTTQEVTLIRAAMNDVGTIVAVFTGAAALVDAYDFRHNISKFAGLGY